MTCCAFYDLTHSCCNVLFLFTIDDAGRDVMCVRFDAADKGQDFDDAVKKIKND